ncbi:MAG: flavodoxin family protein [Candidatus Bathyarchaeota archaeon]|nr:flavodoxin family protein [Candidatus Bathyarchaeota archaeon]
MLAKVIVVYESKYGNTKRVAETIIAGMNEIEEVEAVLKEPKHVDPTEVLDYDLILIGSPNHVGGPTRGVKKFIDKLGKIELEGKMGAVFDTYLGGDFNKAVRKMEKRIDEKVPGLKLITSGLSIRVKGFTGPIVEDDLPKCRDFGKKLANQLKT